MSITNYIVTWPNPILSTGTNLILKFDEALDKKLKILGVMMEMANGVGIAAPQLGLLESFFIIRTPEGFKEYINPKILKTGDEIRELEEGCLSIPGCHGTVPRFTKLTIGYQDVNGNRHDDEVEGKLAHIIQHEMDHLQGVLYIDYLSRLKRDMTKSKMKKFHKKLTREYFAKLRQNQAI